MLFLFILKPEILRIDPFLNHKYIILNHCFLLIMATKSTFIGYSAIQGLGPIYDIELINQDLLNRINTRKGEKVMDPEFGSIIWDLLFELKTPNIITEIQNDLTNIVNSEPRVTLQQIEVFEQDYGYVGVLTMYYNQLQTVGNLQVTFNSQLQTAGQNNTGS